MDSPKHPQIREQKKEIEDKVSSPPPPGATSPSHEFSFTISHQSTLPPLCPSLKINNSCTDNASTSSPAKIDLSPVNNVFSDGALQLASNYTKASPRNSNSSAENFSLPLDRIESDISRRCNTANSSSKTEATKTRIKSISDIFRIWRAKTEETERRNIDTKMKTNKKKLELGLVLKRFMSMVENIFSNNRREKERRDLQKRPHSFSVPRERERLKKRRGQRSAPASMRGSPSHSGHFSMGSMNKLSSSSDESTMEELQNAIEAAIAHCKSSIASKEG